MPCGQSTCFWLTGNEVCGDGLTLGNEIGMDSFCDDGNDMSDDGCSSKCTVECGYACAGGTASKADMCETSSDNDCERTAGTLALPA